MTTLTYVSRDGLTRHACTWNTDDGEVVEAGPIKDMHETRREGFDFALDAALRPCCQDTYRTMKS